MAIQCEWDGESHTYRERIAISDGSVRCCETGILIPDGFPYADCQLGSGEDDIKWEPFPQAMEVWRWARNRSKAQGHCFCFGGIDVELDYVCRGDPEWMIQVEWGSVCKRVEERYSEGKRPRLRQKERASLESGEYVLWVPYTTGVVPNKGRHQ